MNDYKIAIEAVKMAELSLHPDKAPRYSKDKIEEERARVSAGLLKAIELLEGISK
jgi:hypothetical protein